MLKFMFICLAVLSTACPFNVFSAEIINIGVLALRGGDKTVNKWQPTADYLNATIPEFEFRVVPLSNDNIADAIASESVHFILSNPASYASLEVTHGITRLATLKIKQLGRIFTRYGAVIFTRADRYDISSMKDLVGKRFMAVHQNAFGGWWMALRELKQNGINPAKDFSALEWSGFPQDQIVIAVRNGDIDAGTVRTNILERMALEGHISLNEFKIINQKKTAGFPFLHSTRLYPEWAFATTHATPHELAQKVAIALLSLPNHLIDTSTGYSGGWTIPLDYQPVHELMRELQVGPYVLTNNVKVSTLLKSFIYKSSYILFSLTCVIVLAAGYFFNKNKRLNTSYNELKKKLQLNLESTDAQRFFHKRINALIKITTTKNSPPADIITAILKLGCDIFGTEDATLFIKAQPRSELMTLGSYCSVTKPLAETEKNLIANSIVYLTSKSPNPIIISNLELEPNYKHRIKTVKSYIGIKIEVSNNLYGVLCFYSRGKLRTIINDDNRLIDLIKFSIESIAQRQFSNRDRLPATHNVLHL